MVRGSSLVVLPSLLMWCEKPSTDHPATKKTPAGRLEFAVVGSFMTFATYPPPAGRVVPTSLPSVRFQACFLFIKKTMRIRYVFRPRDAYTEGIKGILATKVVPGAVLCVQDTV